MIPQYHIPALFALALSILVLGGTVTRSASCAAAPINGVWENQQAETLDLVRIQLVPKCDSRHPGVLIWQVKVWGKCRPRNCHWGTKLAASRDPGKVVVKYDTYVAERFIKVETAGYAIRATYLIDYRSEARADERGQITLVPSR